MSVSILEALQNADYNLRQTTLQTSYMSQRQKIPVLSFFTGGGFLDMGFELAGFDIWWTNECNIAFIKGYESGLTAWRRSTGNNRPARIACQAPVETVTPRQIETEVFPDGKPPLWGVIGGPPCPDFSNGGKNRGRAGDSGKLLEVFIHYICDLSPDFFLIENVPGLLRTKRHKAFFDDLVQKLRNCQSAYVCDVTTLNAIEFGVPQDRERVFLVGVKPPIFEMRLQRKPSGNETGWFDWPEPVFPDALQSYKWPETASQKPAQPEGIPVELMTGSYLDGPDPPAKHPNAEDQFQPYSAKFKTTKEGDISHKSFKRLHRWRYSPTVAYGNNEVHLHPWEDRRLSVREALRLQSAPDAYSLPQEMTLTAKFKMVANGVPIKLAHAVARSVSAFLTA